MSPDIPGNPISISVSQLAGWQQANTPHLVLDVREPAELEICQLENAVHIPMAQVPGRITELPGDVPLVIICHHGMRSMQVVNYLRHAGLDNAINLDGGIDAWAAEIDPSVGRY